MIRVVTIILLLAFLSCSSQTESKVNSIVNSKWVCRIAEDCINVYEFKTDNKFSFVSCEMKDEYYGKYYFDEDTLILEQLGSIYDNELSKESIHRAEKKLYKAVINKNQLTHINTSDWINGKWVKSDFKFDTNYSYKRIK